MIEYNGMKLEEVTAGYWPEGVTLVNEHGTVIDGALCIFASVVFTKRHMTYRSNHWAVLPPKPPARRLTRREVYSLWRKGWDYKGPSGVVDLPSYSDAYGSDEELEGSMIRAHDSDEWLEPTSEVLR